MLFRLRLSLCFGVIPISSLHLKHTTTSVRHPSGVWPDIPVPCIYASHGLPLSFRWLHNITGVVLVCNEVSARDRRRGRREGQCTTFYSFPDATLSECRHGCVPSLDSMTSSPVPVGLSTSRSPRQCTECIVVENRMRHSLLCNGETKGFASHLRAPQAYNRNSTGRNEREAKPIFTQPAIPC